MHSLSGRRYTPFCRSISWASGCFIDRSPPENTFEQDKDTFCTIYLLAEYGVQLAAKASMAESLQSALERIPKATSGCKSAAGSVTDTSTVPR